MVILTISYHEKSKRLSNESIKSPSAPNDPSLDYLRTKTRVEFIGNSFKQDKVTYNHDKIVNIYIVHEINKTYNISSYTTLKNCLFGVVSLTKDVDIDNYEYSGYCIGFSRKGEFSVGNRIGKNVIIFEVDMRYLFVNRT